MNRPRPSKKTATTRKRRSTASDAHPSITALMLEAMEGEKPEDVMRRKCRDLVGWAKNRGWSGPPFDPEILAGLLKIRVEDTLEEFEGDGRIFPHGNRVVIQFRSDRLVERQRFTIFHEIAHTCFPDVFEMIRKHNSSSDQDAGHKKFENLCDIGAGELLLPYEELVADLSAKKFSMQCADELRIRYRASVEATLKRMLDLTSHPCAAVFLTDQSFKNFRAEPHRMLVKWMWKSSTFKGYIPTGTLLPKGSCLVSTCGESSHPFPTSPETWKLNKYPRTWYVETMRLPFVPENLQYPKVVAMLHSRRP